MKIPDDVQYVIELPPERLQRLRTFSLPLIGSRKGVYVCEGYAITPTKFIAIVATCECSGFTAVRFMRFLDWYGCAHKNDICKQCFKKAEVPAPEPKRGPKGWGYL
jgi:hypothetical protein